MKPRVIHINQAPQGWENNPEFVYIGRPKFINGRVLEGKWGNPHLIDQECPACKQEGIPRMVHLRGQTLPYYEKTMRQKMESDPDLSNEIKALWGRVLVCFCKPRACHGDVLANLCEELNKEENNE